MTSSGPFAVLWNSDRHGTASVGDPHQREHRGELAQTTPGGLSGEVVGRLGDQHDHDQVVEQFERADHPLAWLLAMGTRMSEPLL